MLCCPILGRRTSLAVCMKPLSLQTCPCATEVLWKATKGDIWMLADGQSYRCRRTAGSSIYPCGLLVLQVWCSLSHCRGLCPFGLWPRPPLWWLKKVRGSGRCGPPSHLLSAQAHKHTIICGAALPRASLLITCSSHFSFWFLINPPCSTGAPSTFGHWSLIEKGTFQTCVLIELATILGGFWIYGSGFFFLAQ